MMNLKLRHEDGVSKIMSSFSNCNCPCCSSPMLHHLRHRQEYWFCRQCWQEMPDLSISLKKASFPQNRIVNLSSNLIKRSQAVAV